MSKKHLFISLMASLPLLAGAADLDRLLDKIREDARNLGISIGSVIDGLRGAGPEPAVSNEYGPDHGNGFDAAHRVAVGERLLASIDPKGDVDFFVFTPRHSDNYVIYTTGPTKTRGTIFNAGRDEIAADSGSGESGNFRIAKRLEGGFPYYVRVDGHFGKGPYFLRIDGPEGHTPPNDEGGFSSWNGAEVRVGEAKAAALQKPGDIDYFRFVPAHDAVYVIYTTGPSDTSGVLYSAAHEELASDQGSGEERNFRIARLLNRGVTYFVRVTGRYNNSVGDYSLHIDGPEGGTRTDVGGFSSWTAEPIKVGASVSTLLEKKGDLDYFKFTTERSGTHVIHTTGSVDTEGTLLTEAHEEMERSNSGGEGRNFRIVRKLEKGTTYYVRVGGRLGNASGEYTLTVADVCQPTPGMERAAATARFDDGSPIEPGWCTNYAARYFAAMTGGQKRGWSGNAQEWLTGAMGAGWNTSTDWNQAAPGSIAVWGGGDYGHVAVVAEVERDRHGRVEHITVCEMNWDDTPKQPADTVTDNLVSAPDRRGYKFLGYIYPSRAR